MMTRGRMIYADLRLDWSEMGIGCDISVFHWHPSGSLSFNFGLHLLSIKMFVQIRPFIGRDEAT